jgi:hypothetical protein
MEIIMSSILLTVNLKGRLGCPVKHVDFQKVTVDVAPMDAHRPEFVSKVIKFNDRSEASCQRKQIISEDVVNHWATSECPYWESPHHWKTFTKHQRILSYLHRFDEGFGISFEFIG